jgi:signal transduction histidine kinase
MNYTILPIALALIVLGLYTWRHKPTRATFSYLVANVAVAIWALCFLVLHELEHELPVNPISQLQLMAAIVFVNGYFSMTMLYPAEIKVFPQAILWLNALCGSVFAGLILFTRYVSHSRLEEGGIVFDDGAGYRYYSLYLIVLCVGMLGNLLSSYWRLPEYRVRVAYMLAGIALFVGSAILFDLILVLLGNDDLIALGPISAIFPALTFAYAITKHDLLDMHVVIRRNTAKTIVAASILFTLYLVLQLRDSGAFYWVLSAVVLLCAFSAGPLEMRLVTTARRKFVRNGYDAESILDRLAESIRFESNRKDLFRDLAVDIDSTFELERAHFISAISGQQDKAHLYEVCSIDAEAPIERLSTTHPLILACDKVRSPFFIGALLDEEVATIKQLGYPLDSSTLLVPFHSPEHLEGVLVLGERSNQDEFSKIDLAFFSRLITYVSVILYRMTPFENIERLYFENQRRHHEAEIQLVRGERTKAIAHATRQAHHEIRTPLSIIRMSARRIVDKASAEKYKQIIDAQVDRAMEIVDETLVITDGGVLEGRTLVDINRVLQRCVELLPETDYQIVLELESSLPCIEGVSSDLQVLFSNLLKNAIEALRDNGRITVVSFLYHEDIVVEIIDNGVGVDPEYREKIWEPYFSGKITAAGNSTAKRGWGLTICNRIITEHKGTIKLTSKLGEGSIFGIRLPIAPDTTCAALSPSETLSQ